MLTPLEVQILMHYSTSGSDFPNLRIEVIERAIEKFVKAGILKVNDKYMNIDGGHTSNMQYLPVYLALNVYMEAVCSVPLPVMTWSIPKSESN